MSVGDLGWWPKFESDDWAQRFRRQGRAQSRSRWLRVAAILGILLVAIACEFRWSWLQAKLLATLSAKLNYQLTPGRSLSIAAAPGGPYDRRMGYVLLPS